MDRRRRELLGKSRADDADVRGEHEYPGQTLQEDDDLNEEPAPVDRSHYAAGADGTQMVSEPSGAAPPEEDR